MDRSRVRLPAEIGRPVSGEATGGEIVWFERRQAGPGFTARDRSELARWGAEACRAVVLEEASTAFAMLYQGSTPWASWAVARQDGTLLVWDCVSFADIGRFGSMLDALAAISGQSCGEEETRSNVLPFVAARGRLGDHAGPRPVQ